MNDPNTRPHTGPHTGPLAKGTDVNKRFGVAGVDDNSSRLTEVSCWMNDTVGESMFDHVEFGPGELIPLSVVRKRNDGYLVYGIRVSVMPSTN